MSDEQIKVAEFHQKFKHPVNVGRPKPLSTTRGELRYRMIEEELDEFGSALNTDDLVEQYDALLDLAYLAIGGIVELGLNFSDGFDEVHRSNMSKKGIGPTGKIEKGDKYFKPNLKRIVDNAIELSDWNKRIGAPESDIRDVFGGVTFERPSIVPNGDHDNA